MVPNQFVHAHHSKPVSTSLSFKVLLIFKVQILLESFSNELEQAVLFLTIVSVLTIGDSVSQHFTFCD